MRSQENLPIYGDGGNIRDWLYVEDHADALLLVLEKGTVGRSYNIGGENERTNLELVKTLCEILDRLKPRDEGSYAELITFVADLLVTMHAMLLIPVHTRRIGLETIRDG